VIGVREAKLKLDTLALGGQTVTRADDLEDFWIALGHADDLVVDEGPGQPCNERDRARHRGG